MNSLHYLVLPALGLVAFLATIRADLTRAERQFTGWMAPRGIVAARHRFYLRAGPGATPLVVLR